MRLILSALAVLLAGAIPLAQPPAAAAAGSKIWIQHYAEYEAFLKTADIDRVAGVSTGVTHPSHAFFKAGGLAAGAAWKPLPPGHYAGYFESYKSEIAAYKLDRMLELDMVPPTVERKYKNEFGSLQLWIDGARTLKQVLEAKDHATDTNAWNRETSRQRTFDDLTADIDDNQGNQLIDSNWSLIKIDHSRAFTASIVQPFEIGKTLTHIDRPLFNRIKALDRAAVQKEIGDLLENGAVGALMVRRDAIVKGFEKLAASKGDAQVFTP